MGGFPESGVRALQEAPHVELQKEGEALVTEPTIAEQAIIDHLDLLAKQGIKIIETLQEIRDRATFAGMADSQQMRALERRVDFRKDALDYIAVLEKVRDLSEEINRNR